MSDFNRNNNYYNNDEETNFDNGQVFGEEQNYTQRFDAPEEKKNSGLWTKVTIAGASALVLTAGGAYAYKNDWFRSHGEDDPAEGDETVDGEVNGEEVVDDTVDTASAGQASFDGDIEMATSVDDSMSFNEAFAAARAEVGPGGVFEWHGNLYGTYTADEWDSMTAEERADFSDHFSWSGSAHDDLASNDWEEIPDSTEDGSLIAETDENGNLINGDNEHNDYADNSGYETYDDPDVEILGVAHDYDLDMNVGAATVDGQEVVFIDVDNDLVFDYMAADLNENGVLEDDEVIDIESDGLTVADLGGFNDGYDSFGDDFDDFASTDDGFDLYEG